jgi:hypothetical protein
MLHNNQYILAPNKYGSLDATQQSINLSTKQIQFIDCCVASSEQYLFGANNY